MTTVPTKETKMSTHPSAVNRSPCQCAQQEVSATNTDFGLKDEKGRAVGYRVRIWQRTYTEDSNGDFLHAPGDFWIGEAIATRDGQIYGSLTSLPEVASRQEMNALVQKRMSAAKANYVKKYACVSEEHPTR